LGLEVKRLKEENIILKQDRDKYKMVVKEMRVEMEKIAKRRRTMMIVNSDAGQEKSVKKEGSDDDKDFEDGREGEEDCQVMIDDLQEANSKLKDEVRDLHICVERFKAERAKLIQISNKLRANLARAHHDYEHHYHRRRRRHHDHHDHHRVKAAAVQSAAVPVSASHHYYNQLRSKNDQYDNQLLPNANHQQFPQHNVLRHPSEGFRRYHFADFANGHGDNDSDFDHDPERHQLARARVHDGGVAARQHGDDSNSSNRTKYNKLDKRNLMYHEPEKQVSSRDWGGPSGTGPKNSVPQRLHENVVRDHESEQVNDPTSVDEKKQHAATRGGGRSSNGTQDKRVSKLTHVKSKARERKEKKKNNRERQRQMIRSMVAQRLGMSHPPTSASASSSQGSKVSSSTSNGKYSTHRKQSNADEQKTRQGSVR